MLFAPDEQEDGQRSDRGHREQVDGALRIEMGVDAIQRPQRRRPDRLEDIKAEAVGRLG